MLAVRFRKATAMRLNSSRFRRTAEPNCHSFSQISCISTHLFSIFSNVKNGRQHDFQFNFLCVSHDETLSWWILKVSLLPSVAGSPHCEDFISHRQSCRFTNSIWIFSSLQKAPDDAHITVLVPPEWTFSCLRKCHIAPSLMVSQGWLLKNANCRATLVAFLIA